MQMNLSGKEATPKPMSPHAKKQWDKLLWAITGPVIETISAAAGGDRPPEKIAHRIQIERLITVARDTEMAPEAEAMWYICCASLDAPLDRDWTDIYMYLTRKFMLSTGTKQEDLPDFLHDQIDLNEMQERDLKQLREWIFRKSFEEVRRKSQEQNRQEIKSNLKSPKREIPISKETEQQVNLQQMFG